MPNPSAGQSGRELPEITIRRAESVADYHACQEVQRRAWGISDESYVVPVATMVGANLHGGLVLGAFLPDHRAAAMSFGFLGRIRDRLCLYSQLTGVDPDYQGRGLGLALKLKQREECRKSGITLIAWAFDPLQAGNARFNLSILGARVRSFVDNMYGPRTDRLNYGVPTDRLIAEWEIEGDDQPAGLEPLTARDWPRLIETVEDPRGTFTPHVVHEPPASGGLLLEIPPAITSLRVLDSRRAELWQAAVREAFHRSLGRGFEAVGFAKAGELEPGRCFYLLQATGRGA